MRSRKALANVSTSFLLQIVTIICGFIVPKMLINTYGSSVNGVIASITQFLSYIAILEAGVGGVTRAALYKPLAKKEIHSISSIIKATEKFFKKLSYIFVVYLIIIAFSYPFLVKNDFGYVFTLTLVIIIGFSTFAQYYFGISYQLLLKADQREYVTLFFNIATVVLNTIIIVVLTKLNATIHIVKLGSTLIYISRPIFMHLYVTKRYQINKKCEPDHNSIKQKWDALGHHIAYYIHHNTDVAVLTLFTNLKEVSVYSIYFMVVLSVGKIVRTISSGIEAAFGNMIANDEKDALNRNLSIYEFIAYTLSAIIFTSTAILILPFISIYTDGITDANYYRPLFAMLLIMAEAIYCIRVPYQTIVMAAGHFKQTRNGAFIEAVVNIIISVVLVNYLGIIGVAIGTFCAMAFRTIQYVIYLSRNIIHRRVEIFVFRLILNIFCTTIIVLISNHITFISVTSYLSWVLYACIITMVSATTTIFFNAIIYKQDVKNIILIVKRLFVR